MRPFCFLFFYDQPTGSFCYGFLFKLDPVPPKSIDTYVPNGYSRDGRLRNGWLTSSDLDGVGRVWLDLTRYELRYVVGDETLVLAINEQKHG
jgi:hypothetical protein